MKRVASLKLWNNIPNEQDRKKHGTCATWKGFTIEGRSEKYKNEDVKVGCKINMVEALH